MLVHLEFWYGVFDLKSVTCVYLIMPAPDIHCFQIFLETFPPSVPLVAVNNVLQSLAFAAAKQRI
jgi:hypothetical protein